MSDRNNLIALDMDGVIINLTPHWIDFARQYLGEDLPILDEKAYSFSQRLGIQKETEDVIWHEFTRQGQWANAPAYSDAKEAVQLLFDAGFDVMCITAAPENVMLQRKASLEQVGLTHKPVVCTGGSGMPNAHPDKYSALMRYQPGFFVDDQLSNLVSAKRANIEHRIWNDIGDSQFNIEFCPTQWDKHATHRASRLSDAVAHIVATTHDVSHNVGAKKIIAR